MGIDRRNTTQALASPKPVTTSQEAANRNTTTKQRECVPERVRPDFLGDPGLPGDPADDPSGAMPVQPPPIGRQEDGPFHALAGRQVGL